MAKTLQLRRGTTAELSSVTGSVGELFVDTTRDTVVVMDGSTAGGFPVTGSYDFSSNVISLPDFVDGELQVRGNVAEIAGSYDSGDWISLEVDNYQLSNGKTRINCNIPSYSTDLYRVASLGNSTLTGGVVEFRQAGNTSVLKTGTIQTWDGPGSPITFTSNIGAIISSGDSAITEMDIYFRATAKDNSFKFTKTGEFISHSALLGNVLVDDNIITPLPITTSQYGYYGNTTVVTDQPLIINGDLEILGQPKQVAAYQVVTSAVANQQLDCNKQYFIDHTSNQTLYLPSVHKQGDVVIINRGFNTSTLQVDSNTDPIGYYNGSGITYAGPITLGATYKFRTFTFVSTSGGWNCYDNTTDANPVA